MKNRIILGIGILIILLALVGTGSAHQAYSSAGAYCGFCHQDIVNGNYQFTDAGRFFNDTHKFNGNNAPLNASSCLTCHTDLEAFLPLTSVGSFYSNTHRYNETTLASKMLPVPGCANCHVNPAANNFNLLTGTPTYLTSSVCQDCHKSKYDKWANTTHAHMLTPANKAHAMGLPTPPGYSWSDISYVLVTKFQLSYINATGYWLANSNTYNTETQVWSNAETAGGKYTCASCHTTGYNANGVNSLPGITGTFAETGIACERCHGPAGNGHQVTVNYSGTLCTACHSGSHHGTGWETSAHAPPAIKNGTTCMQCHSPFDRYLNLTKNINAPTLANATDVACGVCHNSHDITDSSYADTFSNGIFNQTKWSEPANAKLSFFNATASNASGTDVFDDLATQVLIIPGSSSLLGPMDLTGKPVSEVLCSKCHFNHGLDHMKAVPLNHGKPGEQATCTDCHMSGANATVGRDMMPNHQMNAKSQTSCLPCHKTNPAIIREWSASAHNDKQVSIDGPGPNHFYGTLNSTTGIANAQPNSCLKCKDPMHFNPTIDQSNTTKINLTDSFRGITCAVCHNIHDMADWLNNTKAVYGVSKPYAWYNVTTKNYTMMDNTTQLCGNCHSNIRYGNTAPGWVAGATNPNGTHGRPAKDLFVGSWKESGLLKFECTSCHWDKQTRDYTTSASLTSDQRNGGHAFQVNTTMLMNTSNGKDCNTCHVTGSTLGNLSTTIKNIQEPTHAKYNTTNAIVTSALNNVKAYAGEKSASRALIAQAYWNVKWVNSDNSWGVHNPVKVNQLLDDAVTLANQANAALGSNTLASAITPNSRNAQLGTPVTLFMSVINGGNSTATGVSISQASILPATVSYQQWDGTSLIGSANTPADIAAGATANYVLTINATSTFSSSAMTFNVSGNQVAAPISAVNTLTISASATPTPDVIMISTTLNVSTPVNNATAFAVATTNVGGASATNVSLVVTVPTSIKGLAYQVNQTNSTTGDIIGPATGLTIDVGAQPTFAVFLIPTQPITFDPTNNRIMLKLVDDTGKVIGAQSVAVSTT